jgi:hypothetical protein
MTLWAARRPDDTLPMTRGAARRVAVVDADAPGFRGNACASHLQELSRHCDRNGRREFAVDPGEADRGDEAGNPLVGEAVTPQARTKPRALALRADQAEPGELIMSENGAAYRVIECVVVRHYDVVRGVGCAYNDVRTELLL